MENEKNELVVSEVNNLSTNLFGGEKEVKKITSLDITDEKQANMLLNAMQDVDHKLNDCVGQEINVVGVYVTEKEVEFYNDETGETIPRKKHVLMLFDDKGESYVTGSNACYLSFEMIIGLKGLPSNENPLLLMPIKVDAQEKGHSYLKLKLVTKD